MAEFADNNNELISTKLTPFFIFKNLYPNISFDIVEFFDANTYERIFK